MKKILLSLIFLFFFIVIESLAQKAGFIVEKVPFCSSQTNEFSPVSYGDGIIFCSDIRDNSIIGYRDERNRLYKIFYAPLNVTGRKQPRLFSKDLTTYLNDGPVTFNKEENIIYYSRNNTEGNYLGNISDTLNKLGIYRAEKVGEKWTNITPFEYNDPAFSVCMPSLAPDGQRIYFSSDMPGGHGGLDLYYSSRTGNEWGKPVNLGPVINTPMNESFPFAFYYNKLYFSSEGHKGKGGKDIFYSQEVNGEWIAPVPMDSTINSSADDFGIVLDSTLEKGYFSSNREANDDIFSFRSPPVDFESCDSIAENNYCYLFFDERLQPGDTVRGEYVWEFGNDIKRKGTSVLHCFPGPGEYTIYLNIFDTITGDTISEPVFYKIKIRDIEQGYINSYNSGIADKPFYFDGTEVNLPEFRLTDYYWNFGEGFIPGGPVMNKEFRKKGVYTVKMGLLGQKDTSGMVAKKCYMKKIRMYDSCQEFEPKERRGNEPGSLQELAGSGYQKLLTKIFFMNDLPDRQKNKIRSSLKLKSGQTLDFLPNAILPGSAGILDNFVVILKENPEVRLEMVVHSFRDETSGSQIDMSERWAQEISVYFGDRNIPDASFDCRGKGSRDSVLKPFSTEEKAGPGLIEFVFMEKNYR